MHQVHEHVSSGVLDPRDRKVAITALASHNKGSITANKKKQQKNTIDWEAREHLLEHRIAIEEAQVKHEEAQARKDHEPRLHHSHDVWPSLIQGSTQHNAVSPPSQDTAVTKHRRIRHPGVQKTRQAQVKEVAGELLQAQDVIAPPIFAEYATRLKQVLKQIEEDYVLKPVEGHPDKHL